VERLIAVNALEKPLFFSTFAADIAVMRTIRNGKEKQISET
jgi:hypothetical protein